MNFTIIPLYNDYIIGMNAGDPNETIEIGSYHVMPTDNPPIYYIPQPMCFTPKKKLALV